MKQITIYILSALLFLTTSCGDDFLDVNDDPLVATAADANLLFPEVLLNLSNTRTVELTVSAGSVIQQYEGAFGVFNDTQIGSISIFTTGNTWSSFYVSGLKNLFLAVQDAQANGNNNIVGQSKILEAYIYFNLTSLWEDIPFSEAVDPEVSTPVFDRQEDVLRGIIALVDEGVALLDDNAEIRVDAGDLIYEGDLDRWEKFGNSLKLKAAMMIANKDESIASVIGSMENASMIEDVSDEAEFQYYDAAGDFNPSWNVFNQFAGGENPEWLMASTTMFTLMEDLGDPRLDTYYDESDERELIGTGDYQGTATPGSYGDCADCAIVSYNIIRPDAADRYMTASETLLLKAEATLRGYMSGGASVADELYRAGVRASMDYYDDKPGTINATAKQSYISLLPNLASLSTADALEAIHTQLYINNFFRFVEGWSEWRRTHVPELVTPLNSIINDVVRRFNYPPDERGANTNTPTDLPLTQPMWYEIN